MPANATIDISPKQRELEYRAVTILSSVESLAALADDLCLPSDSEPTNYTPRFFAASIDTSRWIPRICVVQREGMPVGIVYARERKAGIFRTGLISWEGVQGHGITCAPRDREYVMEEALRALMAMPGVRGLRMQFAAEESMEGVLSRLAGGGRLHVRVTPCRMPLQDAVIELAPDMGTFLDGLGRRARRNFRYYRRGAEEKGHVFVDELDMSLFAGATRSLARGGGVGSAPEQVELALGLLSASAMPIRMGLRARDGRWVSVLGGWHERGRAVVSFQLNDDRERASESLSVVMRSFAIEHLIGLGVQEVVFRGGVSQPLSRYAREIASSLAFVDVRAPGWRAVRGAVSLARPLLAPRYGWWVTWVAGPSDERSRTRAFG